MKIVIDTNVVMSAVFFGGIPRKIIEAVINKNISACANFEIIEEYHEIVTRMINKKKGKLRDDTFSIFITRLDNVVTTSEVKICRDPDDDKFINCAIDGKAIYIVSGDKDLLTIEKYNDIEILTAKEFMDRLEKPEDNRL